MHSAFYFLGYLLGAFIGALPLALLAFPLALFPWKLGRVFFACLLLGLVVETGTVLLAHNTGDEYTWGRALIPDVAVLFGGACLSRWLFRKWQAREAASLPGSKHDDTV